MTKCKVRDGILGVLTGAAYESSASMVMQCFPPNMGGEALGGLSPCSCNVAHLMQTQAQLPPTSSDGPPACPLQSTTKRRI